VSTIEIRGQDIDGDPTSCTIAQFITVFETIARHEDVREHIWYGADMSPSAGDFASYRGEKASRIGSIDQVIELLRAAPFPQLDWGVFVALDASADPGQLEEPMWAEGGLGKRVSSSEIEVVAHDDTFIGVTTDRKDIIQGLNDRFSLEIV